MEPPQPEKMADLESLFAQQRDAAYVVNRALDNFKKIGKSKYTVATVRNRIAKLEDAFKECQSLNRQIVAGATADQHKKLLYFTEQHFGILHETYLESSDFMAEILARLEKEETNVAANIQTDGADKGTRSTGGSLTTNDHLPRKNLPTFSGVLVEWESFRDRFTSMIIDNSTVSEVSKLEYLFSCLEMEPLDIIRNLAITTANFRIAWELLKKRYDNKRRLITAHVHSLLNLPCAVVENKTALSDIRQRVNMSVLALQGLGCSVQSWDELLVCLVVNCLDETSRRDWEFELGTSTEFPTFQKLDDFLESRIRSLEALSRTTSQASIPTAHSSTARSGPTRSAQSHTTMQTDRSCPLCKADHPLHRCKTFRDKTISQRFEYVKQGSRCINCLSAKHNTRSCPSSYTCHTCKKRHHTLLRFDNAVKSETEREACLASTTSDANAMRIPSHSVLQTTALSAHILLATARIDVHSSSNRTQRVRALLDQGSVVSIINENLAQRLRTPRSRVSISITGVGDGETRCTAATTLTIASTRRTESTYSTNALIVKSLLNYLPHRVTGNFNLEYIRGLDLADDTPFSQDPIEMIIGADVYGSLLLDGVRKGDSNQPVAQNTTLGWILSGPLPNPPLQPLREVQIFHTITSNALDLALREFWEIEELPAQTHLTPAETECENHFVATHTRTTTGQYCVRLPFVQEPPIGIGSSFPAAKVMWSRQEQRIISNPKLAAEYSAFMKEYHDLGHMIEICDPEPISSQTVYIPHHAVIRDTSATTRLRVVFNASCKSSNGTSLNDHLLVGPKLQTELPAVVLRWRMHRYVYIADIAKMYRQILVDERDVDYQRIIWRPTPAEPIRHYQLRTVTYGTAPAPYLGLRVLKQLALDDGSKYPLACSILKSQIYVDDCLFGADEKELARHTRDQLISLLKGAGLHLRKWASNSAVLMSDIDPTDHGLAGGKTLQPDDSLKVLGVAWNPETDSFRFDVTLENTAPQSKRAILSTIAKLFDPLGTRVSPPKSMLSGRPILSSSRVCVRYPYHDGSISDRARFPSNCMASPMHPIVHTRQLSTYALQCKMERSQSRFSRPNQRLLP
ncbi:uncharacterized protein LOC143213646 [Lasioglossum baleicum]|uniref:uncharacterized protein LOC143213646 n=1 Tax=Lasioglossum baleicum TaxID=434251 RepID=UPI003FCEE1EE